MTNSPAITLQPVDENDIEDFCALMTRAFAVSEGGSPEPDTHAHQEVKDSLGKPSEHVLWVVEGTQRVGGAVVVIDDETQHNMLMWFFIDPSRHSRGLGTRAWQAIERQWPATRVWEVGTPYDDKRNVNFYLNKCGFHAVEFYNAHHPAPWEGEEGPSPADSGCTEESFRFEKVMAATK